MRPRAAGHRLVVAIAALAVLWGMLTACGHSRTTNSGDLSLTTNSPAGPIVWPAPMEPIGTGMQMVTPNCTTQPTAAQQHAAVTLINSTVVGTQRYKSLGAAKADGYVPVTPTGLAVVHYIRAAYVNDSRTLDPGAIESLVYANTSRGAVLVAAMYTLAWDQVGQMPPMPGGCLTQWHTHTNLCFSDATGAVVASTRKGPCRPGSTNRVTQPMIHVWLVPVPGGPLTVDDSDTQVVQAAEQVSPPVPLNTMA
ncbi:MAG: hypothetical protein WAN20_16000 [Pseudonocardiaceae bacterium]|nr:hypothetical protein [Pseudonocardiaceae bacterium]